MGFREYFIEKCEPALFEPVKDAKGEKRFIAKHKVQQHKDPEGNGPDVFQGSKVKTYDRSAHRMGNDAQQSLNAYEDWDHGFTDDELELICDNLTVEEFEQLDELSKKTLSNYMQKSAWQLHDMGRKDSEFTHARQKLGDATSAVSNAPQNNHTLRQHADNAVYGLQKAVSFEQDKNNKKSFNRKLGVIRAGRKLAKEETDLKEISDTTLKSYIKKAGRQAANADDTAEFFSNGAGAAKTQTHFNRMVKGVFKATDHSEKRMRGVLKAAKKLNREETDLTELSRKTLASYVVKAADRYNNLGWEDGFSPAESTRDDRKKLRKQQRNKMYGISRAAHKMSGRKEYDAKVLAKEETDLTELSKHTLVSYANKAALSSAREGQKYERGMERGDAEYKFKAQKKLSNRVHGITKAAGRLAYSGGHAMSNRGAPSGITVREGKSYKDLRKHFSDSDQTAIKKRFQQRMQARRGDEE